MRLYETLQLGSECQFEDKAPEEQVGSARLREPLPGGPGARKGSMAPSTGWPQGLRSRLRRRR
jgi:hypothetical protein